MVILAVDLGDARTGLAVCDPLEMLASPLAVVSEKSPQKRLLKVSEAAISAGAELIVVGNPVNMDGTKGGSSEKCREFAEALELVSGIKCVLWDERRTTVFAANILNNNNVRGKKRKETIDSVAAVLILEGYLTFRKNDKEK
ncbi:MAG: Holliday junction resolvase RuvX [Ruminococcus sp.]|jgi:putative Holliday junction resolvase|nr:Holliday junction resolvase RuvX [Ruminococcus sp.]